MSTTTKQQKRKTKHIQVELCEACGHFAVHEIDGHIKCEKCGMVYRSASVDIDFRTKKSHTKHHQTHEASQSFEEELYRECFSLPAFLRQYAAYIVVTILILGILYFNEIDKIYL